MAEIAEIIPRATYRSVTKLETKSYDFVIPSYSDHKGMGIGNSIDSETIMVGGYEWLIQFYPDGKLRGHGFTFISVVIVLLSDVDRDVRALFKIRLLDQSGKGEHIVVHSFLDNSEKEGPCTLKLGQKTWENPCLLKQDELESSCYLKDDCLKIKCDIGVVVEMPSLPSIQVPKSDIGLHIGKLLEMPETSDIIFVVAGERIYAHKLILAAGSSFFRNMIFGRADEIPREIVITNLEPKVFKAMLRFIYEDTVDDDDMLVGSGPFGRHVRNTLAAKLLEAACKYDLNRLRLICESCLCKVISVYSANSLHLLADRFDAKELKAALLRFAADSFLFYSV